METAILGLFVTGLILCVTCGLPVLWALVWGLFLFSFYAWKQGFSLKEVALMLLGGAKKTRNILLVLLCVGCLTAVWRVCGTIPCIVYHASGWIIPRYFVLCTFALCAGISFITGSSFSTASTVGAICMMLGRASGVDPVPLAGAVLAGSFFGDRCSPMSSSALLVASVTHTNIYDNVKTMMRTSLVPLAITCAVYFLMGSDPKAASAETLTVFARSFALGWPAVLPAVLTLALCLCRVDVKLTMLLSTIVGVALAVVMQGVPLGTVLRALISGFHPEDEALAALLSGGGILSMVNVALIVCLSASFSGIFEKTELLSGVSGLIRRLAARTTKETAAVVSSAVFCMIACNQTLATLLTDQLLRPLVPDDSKRASWLEDTAIVVAPLVPWNIACSVPFAILGAGAESILCACYLYLLPAWLILRGLGRRKNASL